VFIGKPNVDASKPSPESPSDAAQPNGVADPAAKRSAASQQRLTINLGALATQRVGGHQDDGLRSSNSMPERGRKAGPKDLTGAKSARLASSPSSFKPPVTSASDERAVGKRLTVRKPVFLTGYIDATGFYIGGTISFRLIVNNMHKRPGTRFSFIQRRWHSVMRNALTSM
jgi:hypothetical protein